MHEQAVADHSHLTMHLGSPFGAQAANDVSRLKTCTAASSSCFFFCFLMYCFFENLLK
jgi:hypothetical protein